MVFNPIMLDDGQFHELTEFAARTPASTASGGASPATAPDATTPKAGTNSPVGVGCNLAGDEMIAAVHAYWAWWA